MEANEFLDDAFQKCLHGGVGCAFGLALAKLRARGPTAEIGAALLTGFVANRYVAPMLLGEAWDRLDAFHQGRAGSSNASICGGLPTVRCYLRQTRRRTGPFAAKSGGRGGR